MRIQCQDLNMEPMAGMNTAGLWRWRTFPFKINVLIAPKALWVFEGEILLANFGHKQGHFPAFSMFRLYRCIMTYPTRKKSEIACVLNTFPILYGIVVTYGPSSNQCHKSLVNRLLTSE